VPVRQDPVLAWSGDENQSQISTQGPGFGVASDRESPRHCARRRPEAANLFAIITA